MITIRTFAATLTVLLVTAPAAASIDAWLDLSVPMNHPQSEDVCLRKHTMTATYGIPGASLMEGLITPHLAWTQATGDHDDVNEITRGAAANLVARYVDDAYDEATHTMSYTMDLDVRALSIAGGASVAGRTDAVRRAKLFLVAMADNMAALSTNNFRLRVRFLGLPSQVGLPGTKLYATTTYAYSATSPLIAAYRAELLDVNGSCD